MWLISKETILIETESRLWFVAIFSLLGVFFDAGGLLGFIRARTTISPLKPNSASVLVITGVYRITRNPMYVGLVFFLLAWGVYIGSIVSLVCVPLFMVYIKLFQILPEERMLQEKFGNEYLSYKNSVRRWL